MLLFYARAYKEKNYCHIIVIALLAFVLCKLVLMLFFVICSSQVEGFLRLMQKQIQSAGKRGFFSKRSVGSQIRERYTFEDMLCFQKVMAHCVS